MKTAPLVKQMELGPMENFIYFFGCAETKEIAVVDPAWDVDFLTSEAKKLGLAITTILLTHGHHDHTNGLNELLKAHDVPVYISAHEAAFYTPKCKNLKKTAPNEKLKIGNLEFTCLYTPGHSPGCQCFYAGKHLICGDLIFIDGCGRCDLPGSNPKLQFDSLYNTLMKLPDETILYPGHHYGPTPTDTLGQQKKTNPYLSARNLQEFLVSRMGVVF